MIGFYDYTVILTYMGALAGLLGIGMSIQGLYINAILCMAVALVCDTFDGIVARAKKNRTKGEMLFGIQIDSLCDLISFGICPATLFYKLGMEKPLDLMRLTACAASFVWAISIPWPSRQSWAPRATIAACRWCAWTS